MQEKTVLEQSRTQSVTWWVGMIAVVAQGICSALMAGGTITAEMGAAVTGAFAGIFAYCNGNNPSRKGQY